MSEFILRIPRMSIGVSEAALVEYLVDEGDRVEEGDPIFIIDTDKVESEVEAGAAGTVHWTARTGEVYRTGTPVGTIDTSA
jgi:pyruvate/2-oxoglutarate dehydrogenase complex dihydrolipoamide acyltransferase (E2) component